ncbi:hypothetical protein CHS0354_003622 [Potamilus streckersoni]|uniref:Uncharacterized protein n=1 Tax=Potamilus streckersoni TaxID=2493646 RepID=A0AAE0S8P8_9BIVA|nr:hypothetical protein CHS0354_003622 [Potamilus streckersoni]
MTEKNIEKIFENIAQGQIHVMPYNLPKLRAITNLTNKCFWDPIHVKRISRQHRTQLYLEKQRLIGVERVITRQRQVARLQQSVLIDKFRQKLASYNLLRATVGDDSLEAIHKQTASTGAVPTTEGLQKRNNLCAKSRLLITVFHKLPSDKGVLPKHEKKLDLPNSEITKSKVV